ncbi:MAG TPA: extracellular solute-binding protein [Beijerinckiaceae bacterium]|nr:extracellular solute-binding protein [Beijerinckiaceae bacterium]
MTGLKRLLAATALTGAALSGAMAQETIFLSTQLRPVEEATKVRQIILKGAPGPVTFVVEEPSPFQTRMDAETQAGKRTISMVGALHGELAPLVGSKGLEPLDALVAKAKERGVPDAMLALGKLGTDKQMYIPWMQATYIMAAKKEALQYLPAGADVNALTYVQLKDWAKNIQDKTGKRALGFPAGPKGLLARFFQGYLYPSYTGGVVASFKSAEAEAMWGAFKDLWAHVNPNSASYDFMQEPLMAGEVMIAFDHVARLKDALVAAPNDYVTFPAPSAAKGRGFMPVVAGLGIAPNAPNKAGAMAAIEHLLKPETQVTMARELGFFPVVKADLPTDLPGGIKLLVEGVAKTQGAKDALVSLLPVGLGAKGGEFNKVYVDTFQAIVLRGAPIRATLDAQAATLQTIMNETKAPCWAPDKPSDGACKVN